MAMIIKQFYLIIMWNYYITTERTNKIIKRFIYASLLENRKFPFSFE